jgi:hypothetical protein
MQENCSVYQDYITLQAMLKLYLLDEYSPQAWIATSPVNYEYFKNYALSQKKAVLPKQIQPANFQAAKAIQPPVSSFVPQKSEKKDKTEPAKPLPSPLAKPLQSKEKIKTEIPFSKSFELNPLGATEGIDLSDIRRRFIENFPAHPVIEAIPTEDDKNKNLQNLKAIVVAFGRELAHHRIFLNNLSKAINDSLYPAALIEANDLKNALESNELHILITQEKETIDHPYLSQQLEKLNQKKVSVVFLSSIEDYFSNPKLKAQLWRQIKILSQKSSD